MLNQNKEMPAEILSSLGFVVAQDKYGGLAWKHKQGERFIYHILTPEMVSETLINLGQQIGIKKVNNFINELGSEIS